MNWGSVAAGIGAGLLTGNPAVGLGVYGAVSSASSADDAIQAQKNANADNIALQRETNATSIELANTAHQREVADLKAAGLNPILSAKYGGSATPSLTSPSVQSLAPIIQNSAKHTNDLVSSNQGYALQAKLQASQVQLNSAQAIRSAAEAQSIMLDNDVKSFTQSVRMKAGYNKLVAEGYEHANTARRESGRVQRPFWLQNQIRGLKDLFTGQY